MTFYGNGFIHIMVRMTIINTLRCIYHILGLEGSSWHKLALLMLTLIDTDLTIQTNKPTQKKFYMIFLFNEWQNSWTGHFWDK